MTSFYPTDLLLVFLEKVAHPTLKVVGIDMDAIQLNIYKSILEPTLSQHAITMVIGTVFWWAVFKSTDNLCIRPFMHTFRKQFPSTEHWHKMDEK